MTRNDFLAFFDVEPLEPRTVGTEIPPDLSARAFGTGGGLSPFGFQGVGEAEPNDSVPTANLVPLGHDPGKTPRSTSRVTSAGRPDADFFGVQLEAGDILGANVFGSALDLSFQNVLANEVLGAQTDTILAGVPTGNPLPQGGNVAMGYVAPQDEMIFIRVGDFGHRPGGNQLPTATAFIPSPRWKTTRSAHHRFLWLDFDGGTVDTAIFGSDGVARLSGLTQALPFWGLQDSDEDAVIDAILASVEENISADIRGDG